jgi:hypothetical protein
MLPTGRTFRRYAYSQGSDMSATITASRARETTMTVRRNQIDQSKFNREAVLPFQLRLDDFALAMQDVYDFFYDVNVGAARRHASASDHVRPSVGHADCQYG